MKNVIIRIMTDKAVEQFESKVEVAKPVSEKPASKTWMIILAVVLVLALLITGIVLLMRAPAEVTAQVRDLFIILMAFESLLIGAALVILVVQIAILTNLIQTEVKPILDATSQTVNTLKGTTTFLSDNLVEPVIKLNEYLAGFKKIVSLVKPGKNK